jgi:hypothetical protein
MSWFKFWGKKSKSKEEEYKKEFRRSESLRLAEEKSEAEKEKHRLKHTLSISRSGRFKQKKRERGGILDKPELYNEDENDESAKNSSQNLQNLPNFQPGRSPNNTCKDMRQVSKMSSRNAQQPQMV